MIAIPKHIKSLPRLLSPKQLLEPFDKSMLRLCYNENTLGPPKSVIQAICDHSTGSHLYPDPGCASLIKALAKHTQNTVDNIIVGNGSEGVLNYIFKALLSSGDEIITSQGTFVGIYTLALSYNINCQRIPLTNNYAFDLPSIANNISEKTKAIYLVNPNNPTGTLVTHAELKDFLGKVPENILVILDEAYYEYAVSIDPSYKGFSYSHHKNLIILRTFSKAYGMASMRLGYGMANHAIIDALMRVKLTFEPGSLVQYVGELALQEDDFIEQSSRRNQQQLQVLYKLFDDLNIHHVKSYGNFVMIDLQSQEQALHIIAQMSEQGVLLSYLAPFGLPTCIRITAGTAQEMAIFCDIFSKTYLSSQCLETNL
ncbi:MAG: pyridoxal phosphate-dependent aminotransferase [Cellvibrionaceae bacterium]